MCTRRQTFRPPALFSLSLSLSHSLTPELVNSPHLSIICASEDMLASAVSATISFFFLFFFSPTSVLQTCGHLQKRVTWLWSAKPLVLPHTYLFSRCSEKPGQIISAWQVSGEVRFFILDILWHLSSFSGDGKLFSCCSEIHSSSSACLGKQIQTTLCTLRQSVLEKRTY